ncbi:glycosyltransferase [Soehngenia saccharolytica]|nr:glycosyltransferase [Soehngenia saccharolytica]
MRILHIINNLGSGGAERLIADLLPRLNSYDEIECELLLLTDEKNVFDKELIKNGIKVNVLQRRKIYNPLNAIDIAKFVNKGNYDILHVHLFPSQYWVALAKPLFRNKSIKLVTTEHSSHNRRREKSYFKHIDKYIYRKYDKIISISEKTQENLMNWLKVKEKCRDKFIVIHNGIDMDKFSNALPYKKEEIVSKFNEETKVITMVARFSEAKDQPTLIRAMKKLNSDIHLVLVGEGPLLEECKKLTNDLGISERVHFLGYREDVARIMKTSDIIVLSSNWEGFGLSAAEGMASGKPVIASNVDGLREIVRDVGLLFDTGDEKELNRLIKELLDRQEYYVNVSGECIKKAQMYDIENMIKKILCIYNSLFS